MEEVGNEFTAFLGDFENANFEFIDTFRYLLSLYS